ncbi:uncharacterized protein LOC121785738 isoform X1 [Salvia splendens]|nr:uncharacterized protein LOC121785738 isoform X1 [Salvia splendens]
MAVVGAVTSLLFTGFSGNPNQPHIRLPSSAKVAMAKHNSFATRCSPDYVFDYTFPDYVFHKPQDHFAPREHGIRLETLSNSKIKNEEGDFWPEHIDDLADPCVFETKFTSSLQLRKLEPKPKPKPKPDLFVCFRESNDRRREYFVAYSSPKEDGSISPKYYIYPPSFLAKDYEFTRCSSNGLLHFYDHRNKSHVVWNPTTSEYKILPRPFVEPHLKCLDDEFGMWFDNTLENYKLLHLVNTCLVDDQGLFQNQTFRIDLYSHKTNSWKQIPTSQFDIEYALLGVCVYGTFYCITSTGVLLAFDFSTETFSTLPLPNIYCHKYLFLEYKGMLGALEFYTCEPDKYSRPYNFELWVMSDGSWTRESVFHIRSIRQALLFSEDGRLLYLTFLGKYEQELVVFDRANGKLKHLGIASHVDDPAMFPFVESFVQLNGISCTEEGNEENDKGVTKAEA